MKRPGDNRPDPPGGRAAERLRQFEEARLTPEERARRDRERKKGAPARTPVRPPGPSKPPRDE